MPLVRFELRNEYGMGDSELFRGVAKEEPKALLEGVTVAGLVGILRQLGDLAEFAAEIFHDLHEQVTATASRGRKMISRMRHVEEALSSMEKAVHDQKSHIHFAYTSGSTWHSSIQVEVEHLRHSDLPYFIMNSYEGCRDPPSFFLLDNFDSAGPGSGACLRRYSDPSFFKRASSTVASTKTPKNHNSKKTFRSKKKTSRSSYSQDHYQSIGAETLSTSEIRLKSEIGSRSTSFNSRARPSFLEEPVPDITFSKESEEEEEEDHHDDHGEYPEGDDDYYDDYLHAQDAMGSVHATWDLTSETVKPKPKSRALVNSTPNFDYSLGSEEPGCSTVTDMEIPVLPLVLSEENITPVELINWDEKKEMNNEEIKNQALLNLGEITSETDNYVDASNTLDSETETEPEVQTKRELTILLTPPLTKSYPSDVDNSIESRISVDDDDRPRDGHQVNDFQPAGIDFSHCSSESQKLEESKICDEPVTFWTNGGLLGLQPSKPPDFKVNDTKSGNSHPNTPTTSPLTSQTNFQWHGEEYETGYVDQGKRPLPQRKETLEDDRSSWQAESSPPLQHMKMSSHPINVLDTSKLRLKFPRSHIHESVEELMFPSFQLLPVSTFPVNGSCSDSDDDTFCRSFPYSSEDSCSQRSESNSELWAQEEIRGSQPSFLNLSVDLVEETLVNGQHHEAFQSSEPLDLPKLESSAVDSLSNKPIDLASTYPKVNPPPPPPLPPSEWRASKSVDDKSPSHEQVAKFDLKITASNEKEDYLQQIRTKSFQLRPTEASKSQFPSGPAANFKVTAILEKAIAIRQACVGSDEGVDEENWSDSSS